MTDFIDQSGFSRTDPMQTLQAGATATGNGTTMQVRGMEGLLLHVTGITSATIIIQGTDANSTTSTLTVKDLNTGASATSITANGFYSVTFEGLLTLVANIQTYVSGTITVTAAPANISLATGNPTSAGGSIVLSSPPSAVTLNTDTSFTFSSQAKHIFIQNNTSANVNIELDATVTVGSLLIQPGQFISLDVPVTVVHLLSSVASNVNGSTGNNIILKGWS